MTAHSSVRTMISPLLASFRSLTLTSTSTTLPRTPSLLSTSKPITRAFSTSPTVSALAAGSTHGQHAMKGGKARRGQAKDPRISLIRYHLQHPLTPRPLRFSRTRALRHWTIHRAWMLARRKKLDAEEKELWRMYQSIYAACEELRLMDSPGTQGAGRLYRIAMEKKGIFGHGGVPIEYARMQTDTPGAEAWNHGWTR